MPGWDCIAGVVPLPHAQTRLALHEAERVAMFARRFAPARCLTLDHGSLRALARRSRSRARRSCWRLTRQRIARRGARRMSDSLRDLLGGGHADRRCNRRVHRHASSFRSSTATGVTFVYRGAGGLGAAALLDPRPADRAAARARGRTRTSGCCASTCRPTRASNTSSTSCAATDSEWITDPLNPVQGGGSLRRQLGLRRATATSDRRGPCPIRSRGVARSRRCA